MKKESSNQKVDVLEALHSAKGILQAGNRGGGISFLENPHFNKGTAFSVEEREKYKLQGLLPPVIEGLKEQIQRVMKHLRLKPNNLERYIYMIGLLDRNETLFYSVLMSDPVRFVPIMDKAYKNETLEKNTRRLVMSTKMLLSYFPDNGKLIPGPK
jgi:hypothetical protein